MEDQKVASILKKLLDRYLLDAEEKEAISNAIAMLGLASTYKNRIKAQKAKREKSTEW